MVFSPNDNSVLVYSADGKIPTISSREYETELREYQQSQIFRDTDRLMRERSAVRL